MNYVPASQLRIIFCLIDAMWKGNNGICNITDAEEDEENEEDLADGNDG